MQFFVPGEPVPDQKRSTWAGGTPRRYCPAVLKRWRDVVALMSRSEAPREPLTGPVRLSAVFFLPRPGDHFINRDGKRLREGAPTLHYLQHKDLDNLLKPIMDTLTDERWWIDDGQVSAFGDIYKAWSAEPGVAVKVAEIPEANFVPQWALDLRDGWGPAAR